MTDKNVRCEKHKKRHMPHWWSNNTKWCDGKVRG